MFHGPVEDPVNPVGGFDHVGYDCFAADLHGLFRKLYHVGADADFFAVHCNFNLGLAELGFGELFEGFRNGFCLSLEDWAEFSHVRLYDKAGNHPGFVVFHVDVKLGLADFRMGFQVVVGPVGNPHGLDPAETVHLDLGVPAVDCVVGHLVFQVLPEPEPCGVDPDLCQELVCKREVVAQELVGNDTLLDCLPNGHPERLALLLGFLGVEHKLPVCEALEVRVALVPGVREDLTLSLGKLPKADYTLPGCDFVPVGLSYLHSPEGELFPVETGQSLEVHEHPLSRFRPEVALASGSRPDGGLEHQVEFVGVVELSAAFGTGDSLFLYDLRKLFRIQGPCRVHDVFHQVVCPESLAALLALAKRVRKAAHMPGCYKDVLNPDGRALDFHMPFLNNVKLPPDLLDPPFQRAPEGSVIVKTTASAVKLKRVPEKTAAFCQLDNLLVLVHFINPRDD